MKYGFWYKVGFMWRNGFWPTERHIRMIKYILSFDKTENHD